VLWSILIKGHVGDTSGSKRLTLDENLAQIEAIKAFIVSILSSVPPEGRLVISAISSCISAVYSDTLTYFELKVTDPIREQMLDRFSVAVECTRQGEFEIVIAGE